MVALSHYSFRLPAGRFGHEPTSGREKLPVSFHRWKGPLATSRWSFIAAWKLCAAVALGLCLEGRSSSAQTVIDAARHKYPGTRIKTLEGETNIEELRIGDHVLTASGEAKADQILATENYRANALGHGKTVRAP
jgi:Hint domain